MLISTTVVEVFGGHGTVSVVGLLLPCLKIPVSRENTNSTTATMMMAATMPKAVMMRSNWVLTSSPHSFPGMDAAFFFARFPGPVSVLMPGLFLLRFLQGFLRIALPAFLDAVKLIPCDGPGLAKLILFPVLAGIDVLRPGPSVQPAGPQSHPSRRHSGGPDVFGYILI